MRETPNSLAYLTLYDYDALSNLRTVTQGSQVRTFTYDSLSRLRTSVNPESGTTTYAYDDNGNLLRRTDARGIMTDFQHDALNRLISRSYSDGTPPGYSGRTPTVTLAYDTTAVANSKGRLVSVSSSVSTYSFSGFDAMGRVSSGRMIIMDAFVGSGYGQIQGKKGDATGFYRPPF